MLKVLKTFTMQWVQRRIARIHQCNCNVIKIDGILSSVFSVCIQVQYSKYSITV